jgi:hypothetical protein
MRSRNCCIEKCGVNGEWFEQAPAPEPIAPEITKSFYDATYGATKPPRKTWFAWIFGE